jgi:hypothetical protein
VKAALILVVLDLLRITRDRPWFDEHGARSQLALLLRQSRLLACCTRCLSSQLLTRTLRAVDFVSVQALLYDGAARNWWQQTRLLVRYQQRMTD